MSLQLDGTNGVLGNSGAFIAGTPVASTSGTSIDFTSIPSWVKRITVNFNVVSISGSSYIYIRPITSGGAATTGYNATGNLLPASSPASTSTAITTAFPFFVNASALACSGSFEIRLLNSSSNIWVGNGLLNRGDSSGYILTSAGVVSLASVLTGIRITTGNGTDTFTAGSINILYE